MDWFLEIQTRQGCLWICSIHELYVDVYMFSYELLSDLVILDILSSSCFYKGFVPSVSGLCHTVFIRGFSGLERFSSLVPEFVTEVENRVPYWKFFLSAKGIVRKVRIRIVRIPHIAHDCYFYPLSKYTKKT